MKVRFLLPEILRNSALRAGLVTPTGGRYSVRALASPGGEMANAGDLKSPLLVSCGFDSHPGDPPILRKSRFLV